MYTPEEVKLLLKEQAKLVRHAAYDEITKYYLHDQNDSTALCSKMMNLQHEWAIDLDKLTAGKGNK